MSNLYLPNLTLDEFTEIMLDDRISVEEKEKIATGRPDWLHVVLEGTRTMLHEKGYKTKGKYIVDENDRIYIGFPEDLK